MCVCVCVCVFRNWREGERQLTSSQKKVGKHTLTPSHPHTLTPSHTADVLVWTNQHIQEWVKLIGLGDHAHCLGESGVHGGVVALDNDLDHEKLSLALQIPLSSFEVRKIRIVKNFKFAAVCVCL